MISKETVFDIILENKQQLYGDDQSAPEFNPRAFSCIHVDEENGPRMEKIWERRIGIQEDLGNEPMAARCKAIHAILRDRESYEILLFVSVQTKYKLYNILMDYSRREVLYVGYSEPVYR